MRRIRMKKVRKYKNEESFHAMKKCSLIFNGLLVIVSMLLVAIGFLLKVQTGQARMDPLKPDRQILQDISLVIIMVGLVVAVLNLVLLSLVRTEHIFFLTIAIVFVCFLISCELIFLINPKLVAERIVHKNMFMQSYNKDDITFDEDARIIFPSSRIGIRWSFIQFAFKCCGFSGPHDYDNLVEADMKLGRTDGRLEQLRLPLSCCKFNIPFRFFTHLKAPMKQVKRCLINDPTAFYEHGCFGINWKQMNMMTYLTTIVVIITVATHFIQLLIFSTLIITKNKFTKRR